MVLLQILIVFHLFKMFIRVLVECLSICNLYTPRCNEMLAYWTTHHQVASLCSLMSVQLVQAFFVEAMQTRRGVRYGLGSVVL